MKTGASIFYWIFCPILCLLSSCQSGIFDGRISEGIVSYEVSYPYLDPDHYLHGFLPSEMTMQFSDNRFQNELSAGYGMFRTTFINNSNDLTLKHMVKMGNKKFYSNLDPNSIHKVLDEYPIYTVIELDETKIIAGLNCKKALIVYDDVDTREFYIYYTNEIEFKNPNWSTPFSSIDGVLMEYEIQQFNMVTRLTANQVIAADTESEVFDVPEAYDHVPYAELQAKLDEVMESLE